MARVKNVHDECGCERHHGHGECGCGMGHHGHGNFARRFMTKAEKTERLEKYIEELKNELAGAQEHLKELKAGK
jgi:hypothetical protein